MPQRLILHLYLSKYHIYTVCFFSTLQNLNCKITILLVGKIARNGMTFNLVCQLYSAWTTIEYNYTAKNKIVKITHSMVAVNLSSHQVCVSVFLLGLFVVVLHCLHYQQRFKFQFCIVYIPNYHKTTWY